MATSWMAAAAEQAASGGGAGGSGAIIVVVLVAGYLVSLMLHPYTHCRTCNGTPRSYGTFYTKTFRLCSKCGGGGRERRLGARLLGIGSD